MTAEGVASTTHAQATRWSVEHVQALCSSPSRVAAARALAVPERWTGLGHDDRALWGRCAGGSGEPYDVAVDHERVATRCSCPARARPCKHALALLLLWVAGLVPERAAGAVEPPDGLEAWLARSRQPGPEPEPSAAGGGDRPAPQPGRDPRRDGSRDQKLAALGTALVELDRWLVDRMRTGLADPALARYATWDALAARLVDAKAGGLANRVRRLGGRVGTRPGWHEHLLAELGVLHLLAEAGRRLPELDADLADGVAVALGWQVRQADVLAGVPERDDWFVAGRSDTAEDRIVVRRTWLWGERSQQWAMVLGIAAHGQALDDTLQVGVRLDADLYRYPGAVPLRALVGHVHGGPDVDADPPARTTPLTLEQVCESVGGALAREPWLERHPFTARAAVRPRSRGTDWALADRTGCLALHPDATTIAELVACSVDAEVVVTAEWTALGVLPVAVHLAGRSVDLGPRLDSARSWR